jgi:hypothetical protein
MTKIAIGVFVFVLAQAAEPDVGFGPPGLAGMGGYAQAQEHLLVTLGQLRGEIGADIARRQQEAGR